jgi:hypothetical protein
MFVLARTVTYAALFPQSRRSVHNSLHDPSPVWAERHGRHPADIPPEWLNQGLPLLSIPLSGAGQYTQESLGLGRNIRFGLL